MLEDSIFIEISPNIPNSKKILAIYDSNIGQYCSIGAAQFQQSFSPNDIDLF